MIGIYKVIDANGGNEFCRVASEMNSAIEAKVFIPPLYRSAVKALNDGDRVFCVVDDASGFGAILFKFDDGLTDESTLMMSHSLKAGETVTASEFIGKGVVSFEDITSMFSSIEIVAPPGGGTCEISPLSPMIVKFSKVL